MPSQLELAIRIAMAAIMVLSIPTLIVPIFPDITVIWALALIYGIAFGFGQLGAWIFAAVTLLAVVGWVSDNIVMGGKARQGGAQWASILIALAVGLVSSLLLTPIAGVPLTFLALFLSEYTHSHDATKAWETTKQMLIGWGWAFVVRVVVGILMIALWAIWAF